MAIGLPQDKLAKLTDKLREVFPDTKGLPDAGEALAIAAHLTGTDIGIPLGAHAAALDAEVTRLGLTQDPQLPNDVRAASPGQGAYRYYRVAATHDREIPNLSPFTGHLGMVRVTLPKSGKESFTDTAIGEVIPADHLMASVAEVKNEFGGIMGAIERVDLITPPRLCGIRFGAISAYLGYRPGDGVPSFYVLEAGTATGEPKVLYESTSMSANLLEFSGYEPTPFSRSTHIYTAALTMTGDSPLLLRITAHKNQATPPYMKLSVAFSETTTPIPTWPGMHILQAAMIVLGRQIAGVKKP